MKRLVPESLVCVMQLLTYSPEDYALLSNATQAILFGHVKNINPLDYITVEGIQRQLDKFVLPQGLIYYGAVEDGKAVMHKTPVSIFPPSVKQ